MPAAAASPSRTSRSSAFAHAIAVHAVEDDFARAQRHAIAYVHALAYLYADPQRHAVGQAGQLAAQFAAPARAGTDTHCANPRCPNRAAAGQLLAAGWR